MNKYIVNSLIPDAYKVLADVKIAENGEIEKSFRGQISTFGAAISTGSLLAAISFFSNQGGSSVERPKLMRAIAELLYPGTTDPLFKIVRDEIVGSPNANRSMAEKIRREQVMTEKIIDRAIALKLAMNLYHLVDKKGKKNG